MKKFVLIFFVTIVWGVDYGAYAQESSNSGYNPNSVHPIHEDDIMFKMRVWRRMDLKEKQNKPFFASQNEITKHIVNAAKAGILPIYKGDSMVNRMTKEEFLEKLENPQLKDMNMGGGDDWGDGGGGDDAWGNDGGWGNDAADPADNENDDDPVEISTQFNINQISRLEIMEDMIFDKKRSVLIWDIQSIRVIIPESEFPTTGIERPIGVFKYKDLMDLFRSNPEQMIWFNTQNTAEHKNLADAFALRLFEARITRVSNPDGLDIIDVHGGDARTGIIKSQQIEYQLMEKEHELWSY